MRALASSLSLPQHPDQHRPKGLVLLAVDRARPKDQFNSLSGGVKLVASPYPRRSKSMKLQDVLEQISTATRSLKLSAAWLESQTDDQIREIGSGDWLPLTSAVHNLEERVIQVDRVFNRGEEARLDLGRDLIEL